MSSSRCTFVLLTLFGLALLSCAGDQVEMQNGDRYNGKVLSLGENSLILQNEILGKITLPRAKVAVISLGITPAKAAPLMPSTNSVSKLSVAPTNTFGGAIGTNSPLIAEVRRQFLTGAEPAAQQKFDDLVSGLLSGRLTVEDIQREARSAAAQARALKKELGPDAGFALEGYLSILDNFLKDAPPPPDPSTNTPPPTNRQAPPEEE